MKTKSLTTQIKIPILILTVLVFSLLLSACAGSTLASSWPGLSVNGDTAYLAYNTEVYSINLTKGTENWRYPTKADAKKTFYAPPVLASDGQLIVASYNHMIYSLNSSNGQENQGNWPFTGGTNHFVAAPLVTKDAIYAPNADGVLYVLDLTGKQRWTFKAGQALWATPITDGKTIFLSSMDHHLYALDAQNGNLIWKSDSLGGAMVGTPTLSKDGILYLGNFNNQMLAIDAKTGKLSSKPFTTGGWVWSGPTLADNKLYFGDLEGNFYALATDNFSQAVWKVQPDTSALRSVTAQPLVTKDKLYFTSENGNIYIVTPQNGQAKPVTIGGKLNAPPVAAGDKILVTPYGTDPLLIALDSDGVTQWKFPPPKQGQ